MPKERGKEWEHVKVVSKKGQSFQVQCNYCDKLFWIESGQHIRAHLGVQTLCGVNKCEKVPEDVVRSFTKAEDKKIAKKSDANRKRMLDVSCSSVSRLFSPSEPKQQKLTNVVNSQKKHEVDMSVARMCYSTGISFNVVNNKHFREMCSKIGEYGPAYNLSSDYPIRTSLLNKEHNNVKRRVDEFHSVQLDRTGCTIVCDGWSDAQR